MDGQLTLIPTPIGNRADITQRALEVLAQVDLILAEDTRTTGQLLKHYQISQPLQSYHIHNEHQRLEALLSDLQAGKHFALVSDAGTPAISDPGFLLVRRCVEAGIAVACLPGPTAFVPALVQSGLPTDRFTFWGFLPHKKGRQTQLQALAALTHTFILYESPHRLLKTLLQLIEHLGPERPAAVARELTKLFEETQRGTLQEIHDYFAQKASIKGEIIIVVAGKTPQKNDLLGQ